MKKTEKKKNKDREFSSNLRASKPDFWIERHSKEDGILTRLESEDVYVKKEKKDK